MPGTDRTTPLTPDLPADYSPAVLARRAAEVLRKAGAAVWRSGPSEPAPPSVVSFAQLTDRLKKYLPSAEIVRIKDAFRFADAAHLGQFRKSGEPYITHPVAVAELLADWKLDSAAIQAALMHDVLEDSGIGKQEIVERFGPVVADLVEGVTKLDRLRFDSNEEAQAESFRKMLLAMGRDVRVILIKLADRLHNVRTLEAMAADKQRRIARETLEIYAPIAHRLGLNAIYHELQEQSIARMHPLRYRVLHKAVLAARGNRREVLSKINDAVRRALSSAKIKAEVHGREKTIFGIYRKMVEKSLSFSQVLDIYGFRIVVNSRQDCYLALGALHALYKPVPGKFKDYIAIAKLNGYQSLHTTLLGPFGTPVEFQIRTHDMHRVAESGVAAHWLYKSDDTSLTELQSRTHQWLQSLLEIQQQTGDAVEMMENIKVDLFPDKVYVFTPKGKIVSMPRGATPVDFAYGIHTDVGNRCVAARINGEIQPLRSELKNGDMVEIVTGPVARPNPSWLTFVRTGKARAEIRHFLRTIKREESVELGERLLAQSARQLGVTLAEVPAESWETIVRDGQAKDREEILADIGLGRRLAAVVARQLMLGANPPNAEPTPGEAITETSRALFNSAGPVVIRGTEGMALQTGNCCSPIPGDAIVGHMRRDQGLAVHQADCPVAARGRRADPERWIDLQWAEDASGPFAARLAVNAANERGTLARIAVAIAEAESNIVNVNMEDESAEQAQLNFKLQVRDRRHLARVMRMLRRVPQVSRVVRVKPGDRASSE